MKKLWIRTLLCPLLVAGLLLAPLPEAIASTTSVSAAASVTAEPAKELQLWIDGKKLTISVPLYKANGVALAPMKELFAALDVSATFESNTETIFGRQGYISLSMQVGKHEAIVNSEKAMLDAAAFIIDGVVYVPIRFVAETFDATVKWDGKTQSILITTWEAADLEEYAEWEEELQNKEKLTSAEIVEKYDDSIVMIMTNRGQGSGIVIGEDLILTNYHVMDDVSSATIYSVYGDELEVVGVVHSDQQSDLAIIKTSEELDLAIIELDYFYYYDKGDKVYAIGSPLGLQNTVTEGLISNTTYEGGVRYIQTSTPIDHGSSGGALFTEYGELIGITTLGYPNTQADLNFAVSVYHAARLANGITEQMIEKTAFLAPRLPETLVGAPLSDIQKLMKDQYSVVQTSEGEASFTKWEAQRDHEGWLVLTANIDPLFYMYYGAATANELRYWSINLGYELHRMLPDDRIQVIISFDRVYGFQPRGFTAGEVTSLGDGKWRVRHSVIDMQLKDQLYIKVRS